MMSDPEKWEEIFKYTIDQTSPDQERKEQMWNRLQSTISERGQKRKPAIRSGWQPHGRKTFATALAGTCVIAVCLLTGAGVNAATDGALLNSVKDGKETGVYSQQCIVWADKAGRQYRSALVIIGGDDYELYSCPADDTEKISKEKLLVQTYSDEIPTEIATEGNTQHTGLPEFTYQGDDEIMKLVCDYMIKNSGIYIYVPEPVIVKTVRTGNDLFIFGNFWWETYYRNGNTLMSDSGSEMPARLHFVSYGNGSYIFKDKEVAQDGSYYGTSIREFCEGYQVDPQKLMDTAEAHKKIRIKMLRAYVKQNHLDIRYYKDYGWDPVALEK